MALPNVTRPVEFLLAACQLWVMCNVERKIAKGEAYARLMGQFDGATSGMIDTIWTALDGTIA